MYISKAISSPSHYSIDYEGSVLHWTRLEWDKEDVSSKHNWIYRFFLLYRENPNPNDKKEEAGYILQISNNGVDFWEEFCDGSLRQRFREQLPALQSETLSERELLTLFASICTPAWNVSKASFDSNESSKLTWNASKKMGVAILGWVHRLRKLPPDECLPLLRETLFNPILIYCENVAKVPFDSIILDPEWKRLFRSDDESKINPNSSNENISLAILDRLEKANEEKRKEELTRVRQLRLESLAGSSGNSSKNSKRIKRLV